MSLWDRLRSRLHGFDRYLVIGDRRTGPCASREDLVALAERTLPPGTEYVIESQTRGDDPAQICPTRECLRTPEADS